MDTIAQRVFNHQYIYLDIAFLVFLSFMLIFNKKYLTFLFGIIGGILYMIVDYGIFHLALGTRSIEGGNMFGVLLWMSLSYGITNFVWIWLWISKDKHLLEWSLLIVIWWIACPILSRIGSPTDVIKIQRTTGSYHGVMAIILFVGYAALIAFNIINKRSERNVNLLWILAIGILVQFAWESTLLIGGIRSAEIVSGEQKIMTLITNSLLETNLGMPYIYAIFIAITSKIQENLKPMNPKLTFFQRLEQNNLEKVREPRIK